MDWDSGNSRDTGAGAQHDAPSTHMKTRAQDPTPPAPPEPQGDFLDRDAARYLLGQLNGIERVTVRMMGAHPQAESEVVAFLADAGFNVSSQILERMVPPPLKRLALRFDGRHAILTVDPERAD